MTDDTCPECGKPKHIFKHDLSEYTTLEVDTVGGGPSFTLYSDDHIGNLEDGFLFYDREIRELYGVLDEYLD